MGGDFFPLFGGILYVMGTKTEALGPSFWCKNPLSESNIHLFGVQFRQGESISDCVGSDARLFAQGSRWLKMELISSQVLLQAPLKYFKSWHASASCHQRPNFYHEVFAAICPSEPWD